MSALELRIHQEECEGLSAFAYGVVRSLAALDAWGGTEAAAMVDSGLNADKGE